MPGAKGYPQRTVQNTACSICDRPLLGLIEQDAWGNLYCESHTSEFSRCTCCQRLICERLTTGGVRYPDQRLMCNLCRKTSIDTKEMAKPYIEAVAAWLYQQGFVFQNLSLHIDLVYLGEQLPSGAGPLFGDTQGMIYKKTVTSQGKTIRKKVDGVAILKGLPRQLMEGVVAHELGHAWLFLHDVDRLNPQIEEGFCNLLSHRYYQCTNSEEGRYYMQIMERNPDPIYGEGFRKVDRAVQRYGLISVVEYLSRFRVLPNC